MKLPCLLFKLSHVSATRTSSELVFHAETDALGTVEIRATEDLSRLDPLYLVHPWIDFLLDRRPIGDVMKTELRDNTDDLKSVAPQSRTARLAARFGLPFGGAPAARPRETDMETRALRFIARLRQPFGALLFTPIRQNISEYRRVAADSLITVQVREDTPLDVLIDNVRMVDVL
ncbi:hypothetical protein EV363DRAFT_1174911 [Boletus edulis]|nr:hypothetical protein EV363DRAFT_1174911 [Boletus edulis]